ncbi:Transcriptional regulator BlaI [Actinomadura rubteroloni]|uniref:Transcriptional regulator BlaI n=1 Tax=Actinomadura rubteroloni TaxID=1926885 RepID=A0A2P4UM38_9ACTN|nr:BlaI/MecI/CopY family transcriptional regulator [Actinomadura rubteroloni]POM26114.1 Transcriptional regulator BlaI [Actinomadura rubteroloni]
MAEGGARRAAGTLESKIMAVLQRAGGPLTTSAVQARLGEELAYTTVVTILTRLHAKGLLVRAKEGRAYSYAPVSDEPGLAARRMRAVMDGRPDRATVLARFVDSLTDQDERLLRDLLEGA